MSALGSATELDETIRELERRDGIDSSRETSPLTPAADAVIINTDGMTVEDAIERILELAT
jgi:cytidylate kinase